MSLYVVKVLDISLEGEKLLSIIATNLSRILLVKERERERETERVFLFEINFSHFIRHHIDNN